jgi:hypothetical protein
MPDPAEQVQQILDGFQHNHLSYNDYLQSQPSASDEAAVFAPVRAGAVGDVCVKTF